jgi:hypothetical protein
MMVAPLQAQQVDVAFGAGGLYGPPANISSGGYLPSEGGGVYVGFSGDVLFHKNLGLQTEVNWRGSQGLYQQAIPFRPVFWDVNAIYVHPLTKLVAFEALGGIGVQSVRFYQGAYNCDVYGNCSNYVSYNHFLADAGGGLKFYLFHHFFVRPEVRAYFVSNNTQLGTGFSSSHPIRYGASIGYTFGGSK